LEGLFSPVPRDRFIEAKKTVTICCSGARSTKEIIMADKPELVQAPKNVTKFDKPTVVRRSEALRFLWGDETAHFVPDLIYGRGERMAALIFKLPPGEYFRSSETWRTIYDQDRYYYVVTGELTIQDPETGDVAVAKANEVIYWRGARYHFGYNFNFEETLVLDWYAPQERPSHIPEITTSVSKRRLGKRIDGREELLTNWPSGLTSDRAMRHKDGRVTALRRSDALSIIHGEKMPIRMDIFASSSNLTAGVFDLRPSIMSDPEVHGGDETLFALEGSIHVYLPDTYDWFELHHLDCLYLPEGTRHQYANNGSHLARAAFCVAPNYR
jgi:mannose-6-phosphate isomerase-like protein (cupin superfamily)